MMGPKFSATPRPSTTLALVLAGAVLGVSLVTAAQDRGERAPAPAPSQGDATSATDASASATSDVRDEGGEKVKTYKFSGLDIEGELRSPQMLYFLNRLRAEFGRPRLPHRSFMPELQRSTKGESF